MSPRRSGSRRAGATLRHSRTNQKTRPMASRICQARPISRYSQPWLPNQNHALPSQLQDAGPFAEQAADRDEDDGAEQQMDGTALPGRLVAAQHAGDEQRAADIGRRDPEDGELQMPGAQQIARQERRQIDAEEVAGLGAVMRDAAADQTPARGRATRR